MKEESKVKPFYIKYEEWMTKEDVGTVLSKAVLLGAHRDEGVNGVHDCQDWYVLSFDLFSFFGVSCANKTYFSDNPFSNAVQITLDQVDEHLGLTRVDKSADTTPQSLVGCKIDLRNEDGIVNSELSAAFQETCFAQGLTWISTCLRFPAKPNTPRFTDKPFLYTDDRYIKYGIDAEYFLKDGNKEVKFEFERKLNWSVKYMTNETTRKIVDIGGVSYYEDKLLEAVQLLESAKVVDSGVATPTAGGGVPPDRPLNMQ